MQCSRVPEPNFEYGYPSNFRVSDYPRYPTQPYVAPWVIGPNMNQITAYRFKENLDHFETEIDWFKYSKIINILKCLERRSSRRYYESTRY